MKDKIYRELICLQRSLTNKLEQSPLLSVLIHACKSVGEKLDKFTHFVSTRQTAIYPFLFTVQTHLRHRVCMTWIAINLLVGGERAGRSWEHFCAREKLICLFIKLPAWIYIYLYTYMTVRERLPYLWKCKFHVLPGATQSQKDRLRNIATITIPESPLAIKN